MNLTLDIEKGAGTPFQPGPDQNYVHGVDVEVVAGRGTGLTDGQSQGLLVQLTDPESSQDPTRASSNAFV